MLWNVAGTQLHILGSVHMGNEPVSFGPTATASLNDAAVTAFEANFNAPRDETIGRYKPPKRLSNEVAFDLFKDAQARWIELNRDIEHLEQLRPCKRAVNTS